MEAFVIDNRCIHYKVYGSREMSIFQQVKEHIKSNPHCLGSLFPNSKQKGNELYFDSPSYNSWSYNVRKGLAKDFRTNEAQDIINVYQSLNGFASPYEAVKDMAGRLDIESTTKDEIGRIKKPSSPVVENTISEDKQKVINKIWSECLPIGGTIAELYLRKRRIMLPLSKEKKNSIAFHPALYHGETKEKHPALVAAALDGKKLVAVHRHYLDEQGNKLKIGKAKMLLGNVRGCAIKLGVVKSKLIICEGLESGLSLLQDLKVPVWCAISAHNMQNLRLPPKEQITEIQIRPDIEPSQTGQRQAYAAQSKWQSLGYRVKIVLPMLTLLDGSTIDLNSSDAREQLTTKKHLLPNSKLGKSVLDDYLFEERAAIIEYDGGYTRIEAEKLTREELILTTKNLQDTI